MSPELWTTLITAIATLAGGLIAVWLGHFLSQRAALTQKALDFRVEERRQAQTFLEDFAILVGERTYAASAFHSALWWQKSAQEQEAAEDRFLAARKAMIVRNGLLIAGFASKFSHGLKDQLIHLTTKLDELDQLLADLKRERSKEKAAEFLKALDEVSLETGHILGRGQRLIDGHREFEQSSQASP